MSYLAALAVMTALSAAAAPEEMETVPLPVTLDGPARIALTLEKSERRDEGEWTRAAFIYDVTLSAPDKDDLRTMRWRLTHVDGKAVTPDDSPSPDIQMTVDATLTPRTVDNMAEILAATRAQLADSEDSPDTTEAAIRMMAGLTPAQAASLFARDPQMIAVGQGTDLYEGEDYSTEMEAPLPWGGVSVTMRQTYRLHRHDPAAGVAEVRWSQEIDPASLAKILPQMVGNMMDQAGMKAGEDEDVQAKIQAAVATARMENSRRCSYLIDTASGLATKVECTERLDVAVAGQESLRERRMVATQRLID